MMELLANLLGLQTVEPAFWMPLAAMALLFVLLAGALVFDGFDLGVGCLCVFAWQQQRTRMLALLSPWRDVNLWWVMLGFGLFLTVFPHAVRPMLGQLMLPLTLLALGTGLRSVSFAFYLRAPALLRPRCCAGVTLGAWMVVVAHGLLLAAFVMQFDDFPNSGWFVAFVVLGVIATYLLTGASWLIMREGEDGDLRRAAVRWARRAIRWAAAGAIGVCAVLGLGNPAVLARWTSGLSVGAVVALWLLLLACVVTIELALRHSRTDRASALPFALTLVLVLVVPGGLSYSVFPDLVLGEMTLWDGAASEATLRVVFGVWLAALALMLPFALWVYRGMLGVARPPQPPEYPR